MMKSRRWGTLLSVPTDLRPRLFIEEGQTEQTVTFRPQMSIIHVANVKPFMIQPRQIIIPFANHVLFGISIWIRIYCGCRVSLHLRFNFQVLVMLVVQYFAQLLILHPQALILFQQLFDDEFQRTKLLMKVSHMRFQFMNLRKNVFLLQVPTPERENVRYLFYDNVVESKIFHLADIR